MENTKDILIHELEFCLRLWEKQGHCGFGGKTNCACCGAPYVLWKMISGELLHDAEIKRLTLEEWKKKINRINAEAPK